MGETAISSEGTKKLTGNTKSACDIAKEQRKKKLADVINRARLAQKSIRRTDDPCDRGTEQRKKEMEHRLEESGIGLRYRGALERFRSGMVPPQFRAQYNVVAKYATNLAENEKKGIGLLLRGPVGTMKTSLACAVLMRHLELGRRGRFITMSSLLDTIFSLKARDKAEWAHFEHDLRNVSLLVIDDLGSEYSEGWVLTKVDSIISERYNNLKPIIITTNLGVKEMKDTYAERVIDRIRSTTIEIIFTGESLRRKVRYA